MHKKNKYFKTAKLSVHPKQFENEVDELMDEGWIPLGPPKRIMVGAPGYDVNEIHFMRPPGDGLISYRTLLKLALMAIPFALFLGCCLRTQDCLNIP